ncbi:MAG: hypothetical protein XE12_0495 [Synergistales bacterium 54_9]|jgi:hypothetical protein|nr:MAG: hypothetical protein XE12_0495 [Synergistales bacterium 54_9]MDK2845600.1 hypothetical protein [Synergistales bacterium]MDN5336055.1 hypothetical protein [Synergistales bacterium]
MFEVSDRLLLFSKVLCRFPLLYPSFDRPNVKPYDINTLINAKMPKRYRKQVSKRPIYFEGSAWNEKVS